MPTSTASSLTSHATRPNRWSLLLRGFALATCLVLGTNVLHAQPGTLDTSFGGLGSLAVFFDLGDDFSDDGFAVALQPDGKAILVGSVDVGGGQLDFGIARIDVNGFLDPTFGNGGLATVAFDLGANLWDRAVAVAIATNGSVVVGGWIDGPTSNEFGIARLDSTGNLDPTFDGDGKATVGFDLGGDDSDVLTHLLIQPDGKIVAVGGAKNGSNSAEFAVARLLSSGTLDTTFSGDGKATIPFPGATFSTANQVAVQTDNKIVVSGAAFGTDFDFAIARLTASGNLDTTFDGDGRATVDFAMGSSNDGANAMAIDGQGRIVAAGRTSLPSNNFNFGIVRFTTAGTLDTTFSGDGKATVGFGIGPDGDFANGVVIQPNGKIIVAGAANVGAGNNDFAIARLRANGSLDTHFGTGGKATFGFELGQDNNDTLNAIALRPNGTGILAVGSVQRTAAGDTDFGVVQWRGDQLFADGFESGDTSAW